MAGSTKPQKSTTVEQNNKEDPTKFYHHFLYKAAIVLIFFVILPLVPTQAPEFINQSLLTRNWELLHLLFVGIAISYGLFSRRNNETEKDNNNSKFDSAQTLVSKFLQVSSFFEDEAETENPSESDEPTTKIQTWSNQIQHHRNEPVVVVAKQRNEKPLLLPVRSLKSRLVEDPEDAVVVPSLDESSSSVNRSNSKTGSKRFSSNLTRARNAEVEGPGSLENVVLPSPIPWRSRSGKLEPNPEVFDSPVSSPAPAELASKPSSMEESDTNKVESRSVKPQSQNSRSSRASSVSASPKFTPLPSFSSESVAKNTEDLLRKKGFYKACPPPPPPPPPMVFQKSVSMIPRSGKSFNEGGSSSFDKELKRSFTSERNRMNKNRVESGMKVQTKGYVQKEGMKTMVEATQVEEEDGEDEEEESKQESTRKNMGFRTDKFMGHSSVPLVSEPASVEFAVKEKQSFLDNLIEESDDEDTETEDEEDVNGEGRLITQKESGESSQTEGNSSGTIGGDEGPDVDKKADEFIAKFREQIRLQRIESIKRSTRVARNSSR